MFPPEHNLELTCVLVLEALQHQGRLNEGGFVQEFPRLRLDAIPGVLPYCVECVLVCRLLDKAGDIKIARAVCLLCNVQQLSKMSDLGWKYKARLQFQ